MSRTILSLFSGIGLLEHGLEQAGLGRVVGQAEIDPYCRAVLAKHWPSVRRFNDVREVTREAGRVDVVCGGFPCQPWSLAGRGLGERDERHLWPEFARIIRELEPSIVVGENVPGLRRRGLRGVLADLAALGFDAEWTHFRASDLGAPHERNRIWIVATHPDRVSVHEQPRWLGRACGAGALRALSDGQAWASADPRSERHEGPDGFGEDLQPRALQRAGSEAASGSAADPDRLREPQSEGRFADFGGWARDCGWREPPPAVRGVDDGCARGLDGGEADAGGGRGEAGDLEEAPDSWRIAALGNAVVEPCARLVGRAVVSAID